MSIASVTFEGQVCVPADVYTLDKFRAWAHSKDFPETGKIAFIGGVIEVEMSPENLNAHNKVKAELISRLVHFVTKIDLGEVLVDGAFLVNEDAGVANEPDVMFCSWASLQSGRVRYAPWGKKSTQPTEVVGTPDLVVEIVSDSSVAKDKVRLRKAYFDAGIPEYWLIDAREAAIDFHLLTRSRRGYVAAAADREGYRLSRVFQRRFRLVRRRNRLGGAAYRLQIR
ncbi:MAG: Uma2 family endonuclease [Planctomycetia bacterium]|nr:Uma2 family endonuclease [Planctomycetia bacterium]